MSEILMYIKPGENSKNKLIRLLQENPQIKFVSLAAVDLGNNHTDEKIPVAELINNYDSFMLNGIQTDGSSVFLPHIADINNAQVSLIPDDSVKWLVDYNTDHIDAKTGYPVGTIVIPSFIVHQNKKVCSRAVLNRAVNHFEAELMRLINSSPVFRKSIGIDEEDEVIKAEVTAATELEFWVKTPQTEADQRSLVTSQLLKEQYWKRTIGKVRTALEKTLLLFDELGFEPEMGHKEVGGVSAKLKASGNYEGVYEQLEVDWKYDTAVQAADNEMFAQDILHDVFEREGLDVTFKPKPIEDAAGSGEHHHIGVMLKTKKGKKFNAFHPANREEEYLSAVGYASLMGILGNYEIISPFVSASNNAFRRLVPGFEAPVSTVTSLGRSPLEPNRNRTVLLDLIRDPNNEYACRFELRSPNPKSNSFLLLSASLLGMLDGVNYAFRENKSQEALRKELMKKSGEEADYLMKDREYVTDKDIFREYSDAEREKLFGRSPKTVYENLKIMDEYAHKISVLRQGDVFTDAQISSYKATVFSQWVNELEYRNIKRIKLDLKNIVKKHGEHDELNSQCMSTWKEIARLKAVLLKDSEEESLIQQMDDALTGKDFEKVNLLQVEIRELYNRINNLYTKYLMLL